MKWGGRREEQSTTRNGLGYAQSKNVPLKFWVEALKTACYTLNKVYLRLRMTMTPYEI